MKNIENSAFINNFLKVILIASVCINIVFLIIMYERSILKNVIGTYICEVNNNPGNSLYLSLEKNGDYLLYKQFQTISKGKYVEQDKKVIILEGEDGQKEYVFFDGQDTIYCTVNPDGYVYERISNVPLYINLKQDKENGTM